MQHAGSAPSAEAFLGTMFSLVGKSAVITGGGGTLCGAIAKGFVQAGATVVLWGRTQSSLDATVQMIEAAGYERGRAATVVADLAEEPQIERALQASRERFPRLDILVNGAGGSSVRRPFVEVDRKEFDAVLQLNLMAGCILPTKHLARYWMEGQIRGAVINIASMASFLPLSGAWAYAAAKAAVVNQTAGLARELAPHGIRVNAIAPGFFLGKQNRRLLVNEDGSLTPRGQAVLAHTPMGRFGNAEELVGPTVFLASEAAGFVSGITLPVDGAFLCHTL